MGSREDLLRALERSLRGAKPSPHAPVIDPLDLLSSTRLKTVARLSRSLHSVLEPQALLLEIVDRLVEVVGADRGLVVMRDEATGALETKAAHQEGATGVETVERLAARTVDRALRGDVAINLGSPGGRAAASSIAAVPLQIRARIIGALAMERRGSRPFAPEDLGFLAAFAELCAVALDNVARMEELGRENRALREGVGLHPSVPGLVGDSPPMREVSSLITRVAATDANVLVEGESGTGKELVARGIHQLSARRAGKFVPVHCAAIPETLIESELFGHKRGAFSGAISDRHGLFEEASGGTLFLDEIHAAPLSAQVKLLRALQEREIRRVGDNVARKVDVRIVAAANRPLEKEVAEGRFREDLYFRLAVVTIDVPPLRRHKEDIPLLTTQILGRLNEPSRGGKAKRLSREALEALVAHDWPGNVRELENVLQKAWVLASGSRIGAADVGLSSRRAPAVARMTLGQATSALEREMVVDALERHGGNVSRAATELGVLRQQLQRLVHRHAVKPRDFRKRPWEEAP